MANGAHRARAMGRDWREIRDTRLQQLAWQDARTARHSDPATGSNI